MKQRLDAAGLSSGCELGSEQNSETAVRSTQHISIEVFVCNRRRAGRAASSNAPERARTDGPALGRADRQSLSPGGGGRCFGTWILGATIAALAPLCRKRLMLPLVRRSLNRHSTRWIFNVIALILSLVFALQDAQGSTSQGKPAEPLPASSGFLCPAIRIYSH